MKKYTRVLNVEAEPMTLSAAIDKGCSVPTKYRFLKDRSTDGYLIKYNTGSEVWHSKQDFESVFKITDTFLDRMCLEAKELDDRLLGIGSFLLTDTYRQLSQHKRSLIGIQNAVMNLYRGILEERIALEKEETEKYCDIDDELCLGTEQVEH